jgi:hypothetical protein
MAALEASASIRLAGYGPWISELRIELNPVPPLSAWMAGVPQLGVIPSKAVSSVVGDMFMVANNVQP